VRLERLPHAPELVVQLVVRLQGKRGLIVLLTFEYRMLLDKFFQVENEKNKIHA
jgi:hypothetical protein